MMRAALKDALLDLRKQLRGRKASKYLEVIEAKADGNSEKKTDRADEDDKDKRKSERSGDGKPVEKVSEGMADLRKEMKQFMSKKKQPIVGKVSVFPNMMPSRSAPIEPPKAKGKGK